MSKHLDKVKKRVRDSKLNISTIAKHSGLNKRWLYDLMGNKIQRPPYEEVTELDLFIKEHFKRLVDE